MEKIVISMLTENAAFDEGNEEYEVARILRKLADRLESGARPEVLMDINGNRVGIVEYD